MLSYTKTATIIGLESKTINVEVDLNRGKPQLIIIGLASQVVAESKERITSALLNCGIVPKAKRTIINLAPADIKKIGTSFDLAISVAMLKAYKNINFCTENTIFLGELSLNGSIKKIKGILPLLLHAKKEKFTNVVIPQENEHEGETISGINIYPINHLSQLIKIKNINQLKKIHKNETINTTSTFTNKFEDIYGQQEAKRALEISAAGGHNVLLTGPPGTGKSMLAKSLISILPPLDHAEILDVNSVYSVAGLIENDLLTNRPFRTPHHTISSAAMIGGGTNLNPGEISLSHRGVLFMDEIPEFPKNILESLRQPLEDGKIRVSRINGSTVFPCEFILVAASNPCPCGYRFSNQKTCTCSTSQFLQYKKRLSGPIIDRIDLRVFVQSVDTKKIDQNGLHENELSSKIRTRVIKAREIQKKRYKNEKILTNSQLTAKLIRQYCNIELPAENLLKKSNQQYKLSTRAYFRVIKVAQTIADLEGRPTININDIAQSLQYRKVDL